MLRVIRFSAVLIALVVGTANAKPPREITEGDVAAQRKSAELAEQRTLDKAREVRQLSSNEDPKSGKRMDHLRGELAGLVEAAFAARHELDRMEVGFIKQRIDQMLERLAVRETQQGTIIERRIEELLHPNYSWESDQHLLIPKSLADGKSGIQTLRSELTNPLDLDTVNDRSNHSTANRQLASERMERNELFQLQMEEQRYLNTVGASHPALVNIRRQIELVQEQIAKLREQERRALGTYGSQIVPLEPAATSEGERSASVSQHSESPHAPSRSEVFSELVKTQEYKLADGQTLKRIPPPFNDVRTRYAKTYLPAMLAAKVILWRGTKAGEGSTLLSSSVGMNMKQVLASVAGIMAYQIESDDDAVLNSDIPGDWVKRAELADTNAINQLQAIMNQEMGIPVRFRLQEVEREVYVARGKYQHEQLTLLTLPFETVDSQRSDRVLVFGGQPPKYVSGPMDITAGLVRFLNELSRITSTEIHNEVSEGPRKSFAWKYGDRPQDVDADLVLPNITAQTGISFTKETRLVKRLFVETLEEPAERRSRSK